MYNTHRTEHKTWWVQISDHRVADSSAAPFLAHVLQSTDKSIQQSKLFRLEVWLSCCDQKHGTGTLLTDVSLSVHHPSSFWKMNIRLQNRAYISGIVRLYSFSGVLLICQLSRILGYHCDRQIQLIVSTNKQMISLLCKNRLSLNGYGIASSICLRWRNIANPS